MKALQKQYKTYLNLSFNKKLFCGDQSLIFFKNGLGVSVVWWNEDFRKITGYRYAEIALIEGNEKSFVIHDVINYCHQMDITRILKDIQDMDKYDDKSL